MERHVLLIQKVIYHLVDEASSFVSLLPHNAVFRVLCWLPVLLLCFSGCSHHGSSAAPGVSADVADQSSSNDSRDCGTDHDGHSDLAPTMVIPDSLDSSMHDGKEEDPDILRNGSDVLDASDLLPEGCCYKDSDCESGMLCLAPGEDGLGHCAQLPLDEHCYLDAQCPTLFGCFEQTICSCGTACDIIEGSCKPIHGSCCDDDADCPPGGVCVAPDSPGKNACLPEPRPGECWEDSHCGTKETCIGALWCGCAFYFCDPAVFGVCLPEQ